MQCMANNRESSVLMACIKCKRRYQAPAKRCICGGALRKVLTTRKVRK